jgi:dTDP-4-dehydrorhamnose 3,5-epimerase
MAMHITQTGLEDLVLIDTDCLRDARGFFLESYHRQRFAEHGLAYDFVQDNHSRSSRKVLRGFHYQDMTAPMAKLVRCTLGAVLDVAVDLRAGSPTFGRWVATELNADSTRQVLVPVGFGHAFVTLSEVADVQYKCTCFYTPAAQGGVAWNDPDIGVKWPFPDPLMSDRDRQAPSLKSYLEKPAFYYRRTP